MKTGMGGPVDKCDKAHGNPCSFCQLSAVQVAEIFANDILRAEFTPKELRKLRRDAGRMGTGQKPDYT